jgi:DNA-binding MarR family transcriptional regulator
LPSSPSAVAGPTASELDFASQLRVAIGKLSRHLRLTAAAKSAGLTPTSVSVLLKVDRLGPIRLSEVAADEGLNPTMLSRVVADLVESDLLVRRSDSGDRRSAWLEATPRGRRLAKAMRRERTAAVNAALEGLSAEDRRRIEKALPALEALAGELREVRR